MTVRYQDLGDTPPSAGGVDRDRAATPNFDTVVIGYPDQQIAALRHGHLPLVALATPRTRQR
jgi:hypothetical protein